MRRTISIVAAVLLYAGIAHAQSPAPDAAAVYFIGLADGDTVSSPVTIRFGLAGMGVAPAGAEIDNTGHHHLLIDRPPLGQGEDGADEFIYSLPQDEHHLHFGGGQTEASLALSLGPHTLQLALGDWSHVPHDPPVVSRVITVTVE